VGFHACSPDDAARERRLAWAVLLKRSLGIDALSCPRCTGRMELVAAIEDPLTARKILDHLGIAPRARPRAGPPPERAAAHPGDDFEGVDAPSLFN